MPWKALFLAVALTLGAGTAAQAATFNVKNLQYNATICWNVVATSFAGAFQKCMSSAYYVPLSAIAVSVNRLCRSTHHVYNLQGAGLRYVHDTRFGARPGCP